MRIDEVKGGREEGDILTGMITDLTVLSRIAPKWPEGEGLFSSQSANVVGKLCVTYFRKYGKVPGKGVESLVRGWADSQRDIARVQLVETFLTSLSRRYTQSNGDLHADHLLDLAGAYFNSVRLTRMVGAVQVDLAANRIAKAEEKVAQALSTKVEMGSGAGVDFFNDEEAQKACRSKEHQEPIVTYPGALGMFYGNTLHRGAFVALMGPEKSGKSHLLQDIAYRAVCQRRQTVYFAIGDMMEEEVESRFASQAASWPYESPDGKWPCTVKVPISLKVRKSKKEGKAITEADVGYEEREFPHALSPLGVVKACAKLRRGVIKSEKSYFKISCHPNLSIDVAGMASLLDSWELNGWSADVVVVDYADNITPSPGVRDYRHQINHTWKMMRALAMEKRCLLVTASQTDTESYDCWLMSRRNFSEDKRKLAEATAVIAINATAEEKERELLRLNYLVRRKGAYSWKRFVTVASCLAMADACVLSAF